MTSRITRTSDMIVFSSSINLIHLTPYVQTALNNKNICYLVSIVPHYVNLLKFVNLYM
jgi:hypothetical protein